MLPILADENFNAAILRGLLRRLPAIDLLTVHGAGLSGADDPEVLDLAARLGRVLLTHDVRTIPEFAYQRMAAGKSMPGVIEVPRNFQSGRQPRTYTLSG